MSSHDDDNILIPSSNTLPSLRSLFDDSTEQPQPSRNQLVPFQSGGSNPNPEDNNSLRALEETIQQQQEEIVELSKLISNNSQAIHHIQVKLYELLLILSGPTSNP